MPKTLKPGTRVKILVGEREGEIAVVSPRKITEIQRGYLLRFEGSDSDFLYSSWEFKVLPNRRHP